MGAGGATDLLAQMAFGYVFNPEVKTVEDAFAQVNWLQVTRSSAEALIPWKIPGGKWGKAAATATMDVIVNASTAKLHGEEYTAKQAIGDFIVGYIGDVSGEKLSELIAKHGPKVIKQGLQKLNLSDDTINNVLRKMGISDGVDLGDISESINDIDYTSYSTNGKQYSVIYETKLTTQGISRSAHRNNANKLFYNALENDKELKRAMDEFFGYDVMEYMNSGKSNNLINPSSEWQWHHPKQAPKEIQLIPEIEHQNSSLQGILHKDGRGGYADYY